MSHLRKNIYRIIFYARTNIKRFYTYTPQREEGWQHRNFEPANIYFVFSPISVDVDVDKKVTERLSFIIIFCQYARRNFMFP